MPRPAVPKPRTGLGVGPPAKLKDMPIHPRHQPGTVPHGLLPLVRLVLYGYACGDFKLEPLRFNSGVNLDLLHG